jgi:hypothetical protein
VRNKKLGFMSLSRNFYLFTELVSSRVGNVSMVVNYKDTERGMQTRPKQQCPSLSIPVVLLHAARRIVLSRSNHQRSLQEIQTAFSESIIHLMQFVRRKFLLARHFLAKKNTCQNLTAICEPLSYLGEEHAPKVFRTQHGTVTGYRELHYLLEPINISR